MIGILIRILCVLFGYPAAALSQIFDAKISTLVFGGVSVGIYLLIGFIGEHCSPKGESGKVEKVLAVILIAFLLMHVGLIVFGMVATDYNPWINK